MAQIKVEETAENSVISTEKDSTVGKIEVSTDSEITVSGTVNQVTFAETTSGTNHSALNLTETAKVNTVEAKAGSSLTLSVDEKSQLKNITAADEKTIEIVSDSDTVKDRIQDTVRYETPISKPDTPVKPVTPVTPDDDDDDGGNTNGNAVIRSCRHGIPADRGRRR